MGGTDSELSLELSFSWEQEAGEASRQLAMRIGDLSAQSKGGAILHGLVKLRAEFGVWC